MSLKIGFKIGSKKGLKMSLKKNAKVSATESPQMYHQVSPQVQPLNKGRNYPNKLVRIINNKQLNTAQAMWIKIEKIMLFRVVSNN